MDKEWIKLECEGLCMLNITGYMRVWETVCSKCSGTKKEAELIDNTFFIDSCRQGYESATNKIIDNYDFTEEEKEILSHDWY